MYVKYTEFYNISDFKVLRFQQDFKEVVQNFKAVVEIVNIWREEIAINSTKSTALDIDYMGQIFMPLTRP